MTRPRTMGKYLYAIVRYDGHCEYIGYARWEAAYMMRENNGRGRGWRVVRFVREDK